MKTQKLFFIFKKWLVPSAVAGKVVVEGALVAVVGDEVVAEAALVAVVGLAGPEDSALVHTAAM